MKKFIIPIIFGCIISLFQGTNVQASYLQDGMLAGKLALNQASREFNI